MTRERPIIYRTNAHFSECVCMRNLCRFYRLLPVQRQPLRLKVDQCDVVCGDRSNLAQLGPVSRRLLQLLVIFLAFPPNLIFSGNSLTIPAQSSTPPASPHPCPRRPETCTKILYLCLIFSPSPPISANSPITCTPGAALGPSSWNSSIRPATFPKINRIVGVARVLFFLKKIALPGIPLFPNTQ